MLERSRSNGYINKIGICLTYQRLYYLIAWIPLFNKG